MKKIKNNPSSVLQTYDEDEVEFIKGDGPYLFSNTKKKYLSKIDTASLQDLPTVRIV